MGLYIYQWYTFNKCIYWRDIYSLWSNFKNLFNNL